MVYDPINDSIKQYNMGWWNDLVDYFERIGRHHHVNPLIYVGMHVVGSPLFAAAISWMAYNRKKHKSLFAPAVAAIILFNASNLYLTIFGNNIPWWIYALVVSTTVAGGIISYKKIRKRVQGSENASGKEK